MTETKFCNHCNTEHPLTSEYWYIARGKLSFCKIRVSQYSKKYNDDNTEHIVKSVI